MIGVCEECGSEDNVAMYYNATDSFPLCEDCGAGLPKVNYGVLG